MFAACWQSIKDEVRWHEISEAIVLVIPIVLLSIYTDNVLWIDAGLVAICHLVAAQKLGLTLVGMLLQMLVVVSGFSILFLVITIDPIFVVACMILGMGVVWIESRGMNLRILANYTFIPVLYLACEAIERVEHTTFFERVDICEKTIPYILAGSICAVFVRMMAQFQPRFLKRGAYERFLAFLKIQFSTLKDDTPVGEKIKDYISFMVAIAISVGITTITVEALGIQHAQWAIWASASVVTSDIETAQKKLHDRLAGTFIGGAVGLALSFIVPHYRVMHDMLILSVVLSFAAFRTYVVGVAVRSALIFLALLLAGNAFSVSEERVISIAFGGVIGCLILIWVNTYIHYHYGSIKK